MHLRRSSCPGSGSLISSFLCGSSPASESNQETTKGFRRTSSDGNLKGLAYNSCDIIEEFRYLNAQKKSSYLHSKTMLRTVPSFCVYTSADGVEDGGDLHREEEEYEETLTRTVTIGDYIETGDFSFGGKKNMGLIEEEGEEEEERLNNKSYDLMIGDEIERPVSPPMYLATGLGVDVAGYDYGREMIDFTVPNFENSADAEEYYKKMIEEYPCHPLFLRNYAQLLQTKGDLYGAEDYYHRATMADPGDGEILMQYAKIVWELHRDQHRALIYFECAAQVAPQDSNVLAAYASFLWDTGDGQEDDTAQEHIQIEKDPNNLDNAVPEREIELVSPPLQIAPGLRVDKENFKAADVNSGGNLEEYLRTMAEGNPCNPLVLRNYALFLSQAKGDLQGAEEYYSRAILADPADGEIMSQYARLVWELHHDHDKALSYFERAVQATPGDSHVLAAYACFLWETEDQDHSQQVPPLHQEAVATANA